MEKIPESGIIQIWKAVVPTSSHPFFRVTNHFEKVMKSMNLPPSKMLPNKNFLNTFAKNSLGSMIPN